MFGLGRSPLEFGLLRTLGINRKMKPTIATVVPVLSVGSYEETVSHYVEWLGFEVKWEYREEQLPFVVSVSRDGFSFMLAELDSTSEPETSTGSWTVIYVSDIEAMSAELNSRRSNSVEILSLIHI